MPKNKNSLFSLMRTAGLICILAVSTTVGVVSFAISNKNVNNEQNTEVLVSTNIGQEEQDIDIAASIDEVKNIKEVIEVSQEEIPFETIYKNGAKETDNNLKVVSEGKNGVKEVKNKIIYENDVEVAKEEISSEIIQNPINKILKKQDIIVASVSRSGNASEGTNGKEPVVKTMNCTAYTAYECGKAVGSPGFGRTSSGAYVQQWYTIAASKDLPFGTKVYIPYFKDKPNGGWFVVQDRGGAIQGNRIDIYMETKSECISFGRRNLECYIYYN